MSGLLGGVLTSTLLTIMVSGGDLKHDSLKWWSKALSTTEKMNLSREIDPTNLQTDTASHLANGAQENALLLALEGAKEERQRVWWLCML